MSWNVVIYWSECPHIEFNCYSDDICTHESNRNKVCNKEHCPIKEVV